MRSRHPSTKPGLDSIPSGVFAEILNEEAARSAEENVTAGEFAAATEALRKDLKLRESQRIFDWDPIAEQQGQSTPEVDHEALRARLEGAGLRVPSDAKTEEEAPKGAANASPSNSSNSGNSGNSGSSDTAPASPRALKAREPRRESLASDEPGADGREADESDEADDDDRSPPPAATLAPRASRSRERSHAAPAGAITGAMLWTGVGLVLAAVLVLVYVAIDRDLFSSKKTARPVDSANAASTANGTPLKANPTAEPVATSTNAAASTVDASPTATAKTDVTAVAPSSTPSAPDTAKATTTTARTPSTASPANGPDRVPTATQKTATAPTVTAPPTPSTTGKTPYFERSPRP